MASFSFNFKLDGQEQLPTSAEGEGAEMVNIDGPHSVIPAHEVFPAPSGSVFPAAQEICLTEECTLLIRVRQICNRHVHAVCLLGIRRSSPQCMALRVQA